MICFCFYSQLGLQESRKMIFDSLIRCSQQLPNASILCANVFFAHALGKCAEHLAECQNRSRVPFHAQNSFRHFGGDNIDSRKSKLLRFQSVSCHIQSWNRIQKFFFEVFEEDEAHILLPFHEMLRNAQKNISTIIKCEKLILIISSRVWNARNSRIQMRHQWTNVIQAQLGCLMSHCSELIS